MVLMSLVGLQSEILHNFIVVYSCKDIDNLKLVLFISKEELFFISSYTLNILRKDYRLLNTNMDVFSHFYFHYGTCTLKNH